MDFPETDCEKRVLQCLGLPIKETIPFGIMQYIHSACRAGFYTQEIATRASRLLRWPSILKKINKKYPDIFASEAIESDLKGGYLKYGTGSKFLKIVADYLTSSQRYTNEVEILKEKQTKKRREEIKTSWEEMMKNTPIVRSLPFREEIQVDVWLFDMLISPRCQNSCRVT